MSRIHLVDTPSCVVTKLSEELGLVEVDLLVGRRRRRC
jgi:hypothetical protein